VALEQTMEMVVQQMQVLYQEVTAVAVCGWQTDQGLNFDTSLG